MSLTIKSKSSHDSLVELAVKTEENHFKKLSSELVWGILEYTALEDAASFGETDKGNLALAADDFKRRGRYIIVDRLKPSVFHLAIPQIVSRRIRILEPHVRAAISELKRPLDIFSKEILTGFSIKVSVVNKETQKAQDFFKQRQLASADLSYSRAVEFAESAGVKIPSLSDLGMGSLYVDLMNSLIQRAQEFFSLEDFLMADFTFDRAVAYAKKADVQMPDRSDLGM